MKTYSAWRDEDVAAIIPELADILKDPQNIDYTVVRERLDAYLGRQVKALQELRSSDDLRKFCQQKDLSALANVLEKIEAVELAKRRFRAFFTVALLHYPAPAQTELMPTEPMAVKIGEIARSSNLIMSELLAGIAELDKNVLKDLSTTPRLRKFREFIDQKIRLPKPDVDKVEKLGFDGVNAGGNKIRQSILGMGSEEEQKRTFAEGICQVLKFRHDHALAQGFADTTAQFEIQNNAPRDLIDNLVALSEKYLGKLVGEFAEINNLAPAKLPEKQARTYSWEEATDIVCAAYAKLDPEYGAIARRAFDEGWIHANKYVTNPFCYAHVPPSQCPEAHPFAAVNFDGGSLGLFFLCHEMAHVISNYIAGQKHGILTSEAEQIVQESFSHFGEKLLEQEMLKRASSPEEKIAVKRLFLGMEFDGALMLIPFTKFEKDLYTLILARKDSPPSFEEINTLFKKHYDFQRPLTGVEPDVRHMPTLMGLLSQPPHHAAVYPITKIMAAAMYEAFDKDPERFRRDYRKIMEAGSDMDITRLWNELLGNNETERKTFIKARVESLVRRTAALKQEIAALPDVVKPEEKTIDDKQPVGQFTAVLADRASKGQDGASAVRQ